MRIFKIVLIIIGPLCLAGCTKTDMSRLTPGDYISVGIFTYDENDGIEFITAQPDTEYILAHSSAADNRSGNWCINIESATYIFVYLEDHEGQLSWGDIIKTPNGKVVSMESGLNFGNHMVSDKEAVVSICPYSLEEGSTVAINKAGNTSSVYICAYNADSREDRNAILLDCYLLKLIQVKEYEDEYSYTHSCKAVLTKATFDFAQVVG